MGSLSNPERWNVRAQTVLSASISRKTQGASASQIFFACTNATNRHLTQASTPRGHPRLLYMALSKPTHWDLGCSPTIPVTHNSNIANLLPLDFIVFLAAMVGRNIPKSKSTTSHFTERHNSRGFDPFLGFALDDTQHKKYRRLALLSSDKQFGGQKCCPWKHRNVFKISASN